MDADLTRPDGQRTRPLLVDGKKLYVNEHYISVWSPVLRYSLSSDGDFASR
ncbi:hypothetical protein Tcan_11099 [Toxocara canis]|uniref:Uncharacterized protein n=1 Tax=Toxocara canis TaxID=6265 RepID=A0A0B2VU69_TOXCA|nr:hypothetical protein Tcan_11099 [Toxocara canis]